MNGHTTLFVCVRNRVPVACHLHRHQFSANMPVSLRCTRLALQCEVAGSGKTFTMEGEGSTAKDATATAASAATTSASTGGKGANAEALPAGAGVIPRMCSELFSRLTLMANGQDGLAGTSAAAAASPGAGKPGTNTTGPRWRWTLSAQYIEIYLEKLTDLLTPASSNSNAVRTTTDAGVASPNATGQKDGTSSSSSSAQSARKGGENTSSAASAASPTTGDDNGDGTGPSIHQKPDGSIYVDGVTSRAVRSQNDISAILSEGQSRRTKGETNMNAASSRSHAVLTLSLTLTRVDGGAGGDGSVDEDDAGSTPSTPAAPGAAATSPGKNSKPANSKVAPSSAGASLFTRTCKLHLIDLAGSERAEATGATGVGSWAACSPRTRAAVAGFSGSVVSCLGSRCVLISTSSRVHATNYISRRG